MSLSPPDESQAQGSGFPRQRREQHSSQNDHWTSRYQRGLSFGQILDNPLRYSPPYASSSPPQQQSRSGRDFWGPSRSQDNVPDSGEDHEDSFWFDILDYESPPSTPPPQANPTNITPSSSQSSTYRRPLSGVSSFGAPARTTPPISAHIDLTEDDDNTQETMPPPPLPRASKRPAPTISLDSDDDPSTSASASAPKRQRTNQDPAFSHPIRALQPPSNTSSNAPATKSIEQIDLSGDDDSEIAQTLQRQREEQIRAQKQEELDALHALAADGTASEGKSKLTLLTCTVCLESPTDLTATSCGHAFCRTCLMDWLVSAEKDPTRRPNCPACRKSINHRSTPRATGPGGAGPGVRKDVVPLVFMKRRVQ